MSLKSLFRKQTKCSIKSKKHWTRTVVLIMVLILMLLLNTSKAFSMKISLTQEGTIVILTEDEFLTLSNYMSKLETTLKEASDTIFELKNLLEETQIKNEELSLELSKTKEKILNQILISYLLGALTGVIGVTFGVFWLFGT